MSDEVRDQQVEVFREAAYALTKAAIIMQLQSEAAPLHAMAQRLHEYADDWALEEEQGEDG